jgi:hypothetical protein
MPARAIAPLLLVALSVPATLGLVLTAPTRQALARPAMHRPAGPFMKSQEDKEFEEWVRQKKIASGVDPDEDFAAGRQAESKIYLVGGACAHSPIGRPRRPSFHP